LVSHVALADARGERVAQARVRGDVALAFQERARERGHDLRRRAAERDRATQWSNRLARAIVQEERLPETPEQLRGGEAVLGVLDADAKDLLGLLDVAEVHARRSEEAEALRDERARLAREHLAFRRAEEDRERRGPRAKEADDLRPLL